MALKHLPYKYEWPLTDKHLIEVGRAMVESASLEQTLQLATWQILDLTEETGAPITGHLHLAARAKLFNDTARTRFKSKKDQADLAEVIDAINEAIPGRNDLAHGLYWWGVREGDVLLYRYKKDKKSGGQYRHFQKPLTLKRAHNVAEALGIANNKLIAFLNARGVEPPPPPQLPPRPS